MILRYVRRESGPVGLQIIPADMENQIVYNDNCAVEPLVQLKILGDAFAGSFGNGITMRDSATITRQRWMEQSVEPFGKGQRIITRLMHGDLETKHIIEYNPQIQALKAYVSVCNTGNEEITLELLESISLGMLTPFGSGMHKENLAVYQMQSRWANEGVLRRHLAEELLLVPSTLYEEVFTQKFGHIGNKPTNGYIPFAAVEDIQRGVMWGIQLECAHSWQIEFSRKDNGLSMSGGLVDADFGSWMKTLKPGDEYSTPIAWFTVCKGDIDDVCARLVSAQKPAMDNLPEGENELPVIFNEWCTSWGSPDAAQMDKLSRRLQGWPVRYLVMDAGWYKNAAHEWHEKTGDWIPSDEKYPEGFKAVCDMIRARGFIPGMWFEIETCGVLSDAYLLDDMHLHRHGKPLISGARKFWDFRDDRVWEYMCKRVIGLMKESGIGYIKVDSNESIGAGCDGADSLGEGLRQQIDRVEEFFREMRRQIPDLVIENCSSGGHRLVGNFMGVSSVASFSDAFESDDIPIIAANLQRIILPQQSEVWCIVRAKDDAQRLHYKLASGFLGRIGMSGDVYDLDEAQCAIVRDALDKYKLAVPVIRDGFSRRYGDPVSNYRDPDGWQGMVRESNDHQQKLAVVHRFHQGTSEIRLPVGEGWKIAWTFKRDVVSAEIAESDLIITMPESMEGAVIMLERA